MKRLGIALILLLVIATPAMAGGALDDWANSPDYFKKVPGMIGRGGMNALVMPFDFVMGFVNECKENPGWACPVVGLLRGTQDVLDRGGRALVDIGGSVFPKFNGFPNYKPCPLTGMTLGSTGTGTATA